MMDKYNINRTTLLIMAQYRNDYSKAFHLRELSRNVGVDITAVRAQVMRLETTNLLIKKAKGRNLEYSLNLGNIVTRYYLNLAEIYSAAIFLERHFVIKKIVEEIWDITDSSIILFGSFASGRETNKSDIDLFIMADRAFDEKKIIEIEGITGKKINAKVSKRRSIWNGLRKKDPLILEIASNHITLKNSEDFCGEMWRYYAKR